MNVMVPLPLEELPNALVRQSPFRVLLRVSLAVRT